MKQITSIMLTLIVAFGLMTFAFAAQEKTVIMKTVQLEMRPKERS